MQSCNQTVGRSPVLRGSGDFLFAPHGSSRNQQLEGHRRKHGGQGRHGELVLPARSRYRRWQARPDAQPVRTDGWQCCVRVRRRVSQESQVDSVKLCSCGAWDSSCTNSTPTDSRIRSCWCKWGPHPSLRWQCSDRVQPSRRSISQSLGGQTTSMVFSHQISLQGV